MDDHELLAESLAYALAREGIATLVVAPESEGQILPALDQADHVLLDLSLGRFGSALPLIEPLATDGKCVIVMTGENDPARWGECLEAGACAVISKAVPFDELLGRIRRATNGEEVMSRRDRDELFAALHAARADERVRFEPFRRLSVRECEVLHALMDGQGADTIATESFVSLATVRSHIRSILRKLEVNSQLAAVALAIRAQWTSPHAPAADRRSPIPQS